MRVRVLTVELPRWGATTRFSRVSSGSLGSIGSGVVTSRAAAAIVLGAEGVVEGSRVDDGAAGGVD